MLGTDHCTIVPNCFLAVYLRWWILSDYRTYTELCFLSSWRHKDNLKRRQRIRLFALTATLPGFDSGRCLGPRAESLELTLVSGNTKSQTLTCQRNLNLLSFLNGPLGLWRTQEDHCLLRHGNGREYPWLRQVFSLAEPRLSSQSLKLFFLLDLFSLVIDRAPNQIPEDLDLNPSSPYFTL